MQLFPPDVAFVQATAAMGDAPLAPEERRAIAGAAAGRQRMFAAGRACARAALARVGVPDAVVPMDAAGRPVWPTGTVGAISHCRHFCAAAAARATDVGGLGLDAEERRRVGERLASRVCTPAELHRISSLDDAPDWPTVAFSAKEAGFKVLNPLTDHRIGLAQAEVDINRDAGRLQVRVVDGPLNGLRLGGRFALLPSVVVTALWITPDDAAAINRG